MLTKRYQFLFAFVALALGGAAGAAEIPWTDALRKALDTAARERKPLLIDVWAVWCAPCKLMDRDTFSAAAVQSGAEAFVPVKVDADLNKVVIERYAIDAYPTLLFLDGKGNELGRLEGFVPPDRLTETMRVVAAGYAEYLLAYDRPKDPAALATVGRYLLATGNPEEARRCLKKALKTLPKDADPELRASAEQAFAEAERALE